eukprot:6213855-Pleurochrysis_carterae.AAC.2
MAAVQSLEGSNVSVHPRSSECSVTSYFVTWYFGTLARFRAQRRSSKRSTRARAHVGARLQRGCPGVPSQRACKQAS